MVKVGKPMKMYPKNVYHCPCVAFQVKMCLIEGHYSLKDIITYLNEKYRKIIKYTHQNAELMKLFFHVDNICR